MTENFTRFIKEFITKLETVKVEEVSSRPYCRKYLEQVLKHKSYYLHIYASVFEKVLQHSCRRSEDLVLLDFGAGNGLLGIFAKYCGFKKVFINDRNPAFVQASEKLAELLNMEIDGFITGEADVIKGYFSHEALDAVVATDVIEHIYDPLDFLKYLRAINPEMVTVFTTGSNPENFIKVKQLKRLQLRDELKGGNPEDGLLFGEEAHESFLKIRENIIRSYNNKLTGNEIRVLTTATRGRKEYDIVMAVKEYELTGIIPVPAEDSNTCNPKDGSWTERILSLKAYTSLFQEAGFGIAFYKGFFNEHDPGRGKMLKKILNRLIFLFGFKISPFIIIAGFKK